MVVRIRLARYGRIFEPFYRIVVADARAPRDGRFIEQIGTYAPLPTKGGEKHLTIKSDRFKYWMSVGAQPSDPVAKLLAQADLLPVHPRTRQGRMPYTVPMMAPSAPEEEAVEGEAEPGQQPDAEHMQEQGSEQGQGEGEGEGEGGKENV